MFTVCADVTTHVRTTRPQMQTAAKVSLHFSPSLSAFNKNLLEWSSMSVNVPVCTHGCFIVVVVGSSVPVEQFWPIISHFWFFLVTASRDSQLHDFKRQQPSAIVCFSCLLSLRCNCSRVPVIQRLPGTHSSSWGKSLRHIPRAEGMDVDL